MIVYNQETRRFSTTATLTAGGYTALKYWQRQKAIDKALAEGKDIKEAQKEAKKRHGGLVTNAAKGYLAGKGLEYLGEKAKGTGVPQKAWKFIKNTNTVAGAKKLLKKL